MPDHTQGRAFCFVVNHRNIYVSHAPLLSLIATSMIRFVNLVLLSASLLGCKKDNADQPLALLPINAPITQTACFEQSPVIRRVESLVGRVSQIQGQELYSISYSVPRTYNSVWIGFTCNLPDAHKMVGKEVIFSGEYRKGPEGVITFGGGESYYLFLTSIRVK